MSDPNSKVAAKKKLLYSFSLSDFYFLLALIPISYLSRVLRISYPNGRVFDEVHFGGFSNEYIRDQFIFDIHPPTGKLIMAYWAELSGYKGDINFTTSDQGYSNSHYITLRKIPAMFSSFVPSLVYMALRFYRYPISCSALAGLLCLCESMLIVEGRLILIDGILHFFVCLTILAVSLNHIYRSSMLSLIFIGAAEGLACSVKYTSLSLIVFVFVCLFLEATHNQPFSLFKPSKKYKEIKADFSLKIALKRIAAFAAPKQTPFVTLFCRLMVVSSFFSLTFFSSFAIHLYLKDKTVNILNLTAKIIDLMARMHQANMGITQPHSAQSNWYDWPFVRMKSIPYFTNLGQSLVLHPNPIAWYSALFGPIACFVIFIIALISKRKQLISICVWPIGYLCSLLPFALIKRSVFVYHYLIPLIFGEISTAAALTYLLSFSNFLRNAVIFVLILVLLSSFIFFAPWCYSMVGYNWDARVWYKGMF